MTKQAVIQVDDSNIFKTLTDKERVFCVEYAATLNATESAREAGYKNPTVMANRLMAKDKISRAINHLVKPAIVEANVELNRVLKQLENLAFANIIKYMDSDGNLICEPKDLPEDIQQAIISYDVDEHRDRKGNIVGIKRRITLANKTTVLDMLMRYNGGYAPNKTEHSGKIELDWTKFHEIAADQTDDEDYVEAELLRIRNSD